MMKFLGRWLDSWLSAFDHMLAAIAGPHPTELRLYAIISQEALDAMTVAKNKRKPEDKTLNVGKLAAQAGHAYLHAWWDAMERFPKRARQYRYSQSAAKIALHVGTTAELEVLHTRFQRRYGATLVVDAGRTLFNGETTTFVGVGPITKDEFEMLAPGLVLLK